MVGGVAQGMLSHPTFTPLDSNFGKSHAHFAYEEMKPLRSEVDRPADSKGKERRAHTVSCEVWSRTVSTGVPTVTSSHKPTYSGWLKMGRLLYSLM